MMKQNNPLRRLLAALLAALTLVSFTILPVLGAAEDEAADTEAAETTEAAAPKAEEAEMEIISISTEDDLIALAASCTLDAWSREKHVVLEADLDLTGLTFSPIATFGGTFDGQGHTIRGLAITDALSPAGLICTLQPTGRVEDLHIEGSVAPIPCLGSVTNECPMSDQCFTLPFWAGLDEVINQYIDSVTLEQLAQSLPSANEGCGCCGAKS